MDKNILSKLYIDVVVFEKKVRLSLGTEFSALVSEKMRGDFTSKFLNLIGESSNEAKLAYIRLVDEVLSEIEKKFPVKDLHIFWPKGALTKQQSKFLSDQNCNCLARITDSASNLRPRPGTFRPNKF